MESTAQRFQLLPRSCRNEMHMDGKLRRDVLALTNASQDLDVSRRARNQSRCSELWNIHGRSSFEKTGSNVSQVDGKHRPPEWVLESPFRKASCHCSLSTLETRLWNSVVSSASFLSLGPFTARLVRTRPMSTAYSLSRNICPGIGRDIVQCCAHVDPIPQSRQIPGGRPCESFREWQAYR